MRRIVKGICHLMLLGIIDWQVCDCDIDLAKEICPWHSWDMTNSLAWAGYGFPAKGSHLSSCHKSAVSSTILHATVSDLC